jgi:hypothetical protein
MTFVLTRGQLYDLVWSEPMQRLSKQIGISDIAIAKHCRKLGVPVPERGYWNKLRAGKRVSKRELPERDLVTVNRVSMSGTLPAELRARLKGEPGMPSEQSDSIEPMTERLCERLGTVTVPCNFSRVHPAIATLLKKDEKLRQENTIYRFSWNQPRFDAPFERRRLLFLNGLFLGFEKVGGRPWLRGPDARELAIYMGNSSIHFKLDKVGRVRNGKGRSTPAVEAPETLFLTVAEHGAPPGIVVRWQDQEGNPLEKQLTKVIVGMAVAGEHLHRRWIEQQAAWERERREEAERAARKRKQEEERRERERIAAIEKAKIDALLRDADAWRNANNIRDYVEATRKAMGETRDASVLEEWSRWVLTEADRLDPIASGQTANALSDFDCTTNGISSNGQESDSHLG